MLRVHPIADAEAAKGYYQRSDYYLEVPGEWLGIGAERLGLRGEARQRDFEAICDGLNPQAGGLLTARLLDGRRVGWDFNFNASKSVGIVRELVGAFDPAEGHRVEEAHREAVACAMGFIEADMRCRVRDGGKDEDRLTGNLIAMRVTHRTTRPNADDHRPDMSLHDHVVVANATYDAVDGKMKAAQITPIWQDAAYYEAIYHNRLAANLRALGYGIRRKGKGFEIEGISDALIERFSRRKATVEERAEALGIEDAQAKGRLGATTRLSKIESRIEALTGYWAGKLSDAERESLSHLKAHSSFESDAGRAVAFALAHHFERQSVVGCRRIYETAMRHGIGWVTPEEVEAEARRQGLLVKGERATTQAVLDQEARLIAFARLGRGSCRPLGADTIIALDGLSAEQQRVVQHIWQSPDRVILIEGDAGTGKTEAMRVTIPGIDKPGIFLAPSAAASRGTLRDKGFAQADTIARFLSDEAFQEQARDGFIYVDEAPLAGIASIAALCERAQALNARVILQGDRKQHSAVERAGVFPILEQFAGLPVARLSEIWRQKDREYKGAVSAIAEGDAAGGLERLEALGWIRQTPASDPNRPLSDAYLAALKEKASVLVVAPTHQEGEAVTQAIRQRLKEEQRITGEERVFLSLKPLGLTQAERGELERYPGGSAVIQFVRNSGPHRAGERMPAADYRPQSPKPEHFNVYEPKAIALAKGDTVRITANGRDRSGKHRLNNGASYQVAGFTRGGDITLANGWVVAKDYGHLAHGLVLTSHASQGATVDRVLIAMGHASLPAMTAEQFYVSVSRGKQKAEIFTDLSPGMLKEAIQRREGRMTASELMGKAPAAVAPLQRRKKGFVQRVQETYRQLRGKASSAIREVIRPRAPEWERA